MLQCIIEQSPCFLLSLFLIPFCSPFVSLYFLGTPLAVIGSVHLVPRLLVNWSSHFPPLAIYPSFQNPDPPGFPRSKYTFIRTTSRTLLTRSSTYMSSVSVWDFRFTVLYISLVYLYSIYKASACDVRNKYFSIYQPRCTQGYNVFCISLQWTNVMSYLLSKHVNLILLYI